MRRKIKGTEGRHLFYCQLLVQCNLIQNEIVKSITPDKMRFCHVHIYLFDVMILSFTSILCKKVMSSLPGMIVFYTRFINLLH